LQTRVAGDGVKDLFKSIRQQDEALSPWSDRLAALFNAMDAGYETSAAGYGFVCRGCADNCCRTRFYHHTVLEYMSIHKGYSCLAPRERRRVETRAADYCRQHARADAAGAVVKPWCPLNRDGKCLVYALRPMICRLHGIPHVLHHPGGGSVKGPGCDDFRSRCEDNTGVPLDRTPYYKAMAGLENEIRTELDVHVKVKQTIAEMILSFLPTGSRYLQTGER
jgi:Fe-S-cluster containining protein